MLKNDYCRKNFIEDLKNKIYLMNGKALRIERLITIALVKKGMKAFFSNINVEKLKNEDYIKGF